MSASAAADSLRSMLLREMSWPWSEVQLCVTCERVSLLSNRCPSCGSAHGLLTLKRVVEREKEAS